MRLPVHCCCHPEICLGTVEVPDNRAMLGPVRFELRPEWTNRRTDDGGRSLLDRMTIWTEVALLDDGHPRPYAAVKSAHQPIEIWRKVPSFQEAPGAAEAEHEQLVSAMAAEIMHGDKRQA